MIKSPPFGQLITASITPFDENGEIDWPSFEKLLDHLVTNGSESIILAGTTGERPTLTHQEEWDLLTRAKQKLNGKAKILLGTGSNCSKTSIEASCKAQELGADGLMLMTPYYNKPNQEGLKAHFSAIAKATKLPIMLYNNPGRTACTLEPETTEALHKEHENIIALKESTSSLDAYVLLGKSCPQLAVYSGDDGLLLPALSVGAAGVVSVGSHLVGQEIKELIRCALAGEREKAAIINSDLFGLFKALFASPSPGPVKHCLAQLGVCKPHLRLPLTPPDLSVQARLEDLLESRAKALGV